MSHKKFEGDIIGELFDRLEEGNKTELKKKEIELQMRQATAAEQANVIAEKALKKSKTANIISFISLILAAISIGITLFTIISNNLR